ncbi:MULTISPECIES: NADH-dependent [FeFe] hydrogenase, group A6 [Thermodesulfovibrio]|uniref:NADH-dependent [FeFe] hydrogenase, group A6 n=1 Tax=Thermodesulfovibrio TaxID=28261 RepID=UPI00262F78D6|nr:NADH-dependent [FeFe] hydrogenase, group A6 [Thermodesulfovibrio sp.]
MANVTITIDGQKVTVPEGTTILKASEQVGVKIPTLCFLDHVGLRHIKHDVGACRICVVEVEGMRDFVSSCNTPVQEGMVIRTNTPKILAARKLNLEMMLSEHHLDCPTCPKNGACELQAVCAELNVRQIRPQGEKKDLPIDDSSPSIVRNPNKCIICQRCITACKVLQSVDVLELYGNGYDAVVRPLGGKPIIETQCVACGQCALVCPTAAIVERDDTWKVWEAIADPKKHVVVQTAPATHVTIGEAFGLPVGTDITGKMVSALKRIGFDAVFDTNWSADLTIMEEGYELIHRIKNGGVLPQFTSCSPGWIKFLEEFYPDLIPHISSCKSPQQMLGPIAKTYYAQKKGISPEDIFVVSIMPCTAKKYEAARPEMNAAAKFWKNPNISRDVDVVLTSRELIRMIREAGIDFAKLPDSAYDPVMGEGTGAAQIFGATGGVMEAALRTAYEVVTGKTLQKLDFEDVRGMKDIKEASVSMNGLTVKVLVAHSLGAARQLMEKVRAGELKDYHFIEVMTCPGGCIGGGGQPIPTTVEKREMRIAGIYERDKKMPLRKSHENPEIQAIYKEFLKEPLGHLSHELLHTHYTPRGKNN